MTTSTLYAATAKFGQNTQGGLFRRRSGSSDWEKLTNGLPAEHVYTVTVHPQQPATVYAGTGRGLYASSDGGDTWMQLPLPAEAGEVWALAVDPRDARTLWAGVSPAGVWRSCDAGSTWQRLYQQAGPDAVKMEFNCRVMRFAFDPSDPRRVFAALEVGGVIRSLDGGATWDDCTPGLVSLAQRPHLKSRIQSDTENEGMLDAHAIAVSPARPDAVVLAVRMGLFRSNDAGAAWDDMEVGRFSPLTYARDIRVSPHDARTLFACLSPASRSHDGTVYRSTDVGETWVRFDRDIKPDSTLMSLATDPQDAATVHTVSRNGQVFTTRDSGATWTEHHLPDGVKDVYALACG